MAFARSLLRFLKNGKGIGFNSVTVQKAVLSVRPSLRLASTRAEKFSVEEAREENWRCRQDLATVYRGFEWYNLHEAVCTHLTMMAPARDGNGEVMLAINHGEHWSEVSATSTKTRTILVLCTASSFWTHLQLLTLNLKPRKQNIQFTLPFDLQFAIK